MRIVIAGASDLGTATARQMIDAGLEVVVIDKSRDRLEDLSETLDCGLVAGDVTLPSTLREAMGEEKAALLALTNSDEDNVLSAIVARSVGYERVVPQILNPELCAICDELDLADMITPNETVAAHLVDLLSQEGEGDGEGEAEYDARLTGELRLAVYAVSGDLQGTKVGELPLASKAAAIAIRRGDHEDFASADTGLDKEDEIVLLVHRDETKNVLQALKERDAK